ncbi:MAG: YraN family protein [Acidimicrobiia bacterium]
MTRARLELGASGEELAAGWYTAAGYQVLARNWRCREGELDLIASRGGVAVFCEVKTRRGDRFGLPAEAVTPAKQRRLRRLALLWLAERPAGAPRFPDLRFDVASVVARPGADPTVEVIEAAF